MSFAMSVSPAHGSTLPHPPPAYPNMPARRAHDVVMLDIDRDHALLAPLVFAFGGRWNSELWVWEMEFWAAVELGLEPWML